MARKGCGPYGLGAPKAMATKSMAKQAKTDPKSGNTVRTEREVEGGKEITFTTTEPGSGGGSGSGTVQRTPEGDAAYAALTKEQRAEQDAKWRAQNPRTPDQVTTQKRFIPNAIEMKPQGPVFGKPEISAGKINIPKRADTRYYGVTVDQNAGIVRPGQKSNMGNINTKFGKDTRLKPETRHERVMSYQQYSDALKNVEDSRKYDEQRVQNAKANLKKRNPNASEEWVNNQTAKYAERVQARTKGIKGRSLTGAEASKVHKNYEANKETSLSQMQGTWSDEGNPNYNPLLDKFKVNNSPNNKVKSAAYKMKGYGSKSYK